MPKIKNILQEIELLKYQLNKLIAERENLQDEEILNISTLIDLKLNEYNQLNNKK